jgi:glycosyltransferase involved in cell wall biosynthesis
LPKAMKKILFCSFDIQQSQSSSAIRNRKLIEELESHYQVTRFNVISLMNSGNCGTPNLDLSTKLSETEKGGRESILARVINIYLRPLVKALVPDRFLVPLVRREIRSSVLSEVEYDIVLTSSDPKSIHFLIANRSFKNIYLTNRPTHIQYWGDPWYDDITIHSNLITKLFEYLVLKTADIVIYNSMETLNRQKKHYPSLANKMHYLSRGINARAELLSDIQRHTFPNRAQLLYAGDYFSSIRNISNLVQAISRTKHQLTIIGNGDLGCTNTQNVISRSRVSQHEVNHYISRADILVVILNKRGAQLPGKIFDLMSEEKPVIVLYEQRIPADLVALAPRLIFIRNEISAIRRFLEETIEIEVDYRPVKQRIFRNEVRAFVQNVIEREN